MADPVSTPAEGAAITAAPAPGATQAGTAQPPAGGPPQFKWDELLGSPLFWILIVVWLLVLRSFRTQKKKEEERKQDLSGLKKGDRVITIGRMHGTVVRLTEETMTLKPDPDHAGTMTFDRAALWKIDRAGEPKDGKKDEPTL